MDVRAMIILPEIISSWLDSNTRRQPELDCVIPSVDGLVTRVKFLDQIFLAFLPISQIPAQSWSFKNPSLDSRSKNGWVVELRMKKSHPRKVAHGGLFTAMPCTTTSIDDGPLGCFVGCSPFPIVKIQFRCDDIEIAISIHVFHSKTFWIYDGFVDRMFAPVIG